jgi:23S rRNA pseudouridine2605 synthase
MSGGDAGETQGASEKGERIAKVIARAGICSRRDAERLIADGRVTLNGRALTTPAVTVGQEDRIEVDGKPLGTRERTRLWLFNKPKGLVTTNRDPEGRPTVFSALPPDMPRVLSVGRLDINTEGLLLLTNDGGLARVLELPSTGWLRRYRVRAHGRIDQHSLDVLRGGVTIDGMIYGAVEAEIDRVQGTNVWLVVGLREGKNREVKRVLEHLGLSVNRLIRISYGPFQLGDLDEGEVREVRGRVLRDQLGEKLADASGADFDAPIRTPQPEAPPRRAKVGGKATGPGEQRGTRTEDRPDSPRKRVAGARPKRDGGRPNEPDPEAIRTRRRTGQTQSKNRREAGREDITLAPKRQSRRPKSAATRKPRRGPDADRRRTP